MPAQWLVYAVCLSDASKFTATYRQRRRRLLLGGYLKACALLHYFYLFRSDDPFVLPAERAARQTETENEEKGIQFFPMCDQTNGI